MRARILAAILSLAAISAPLLALAQQVAPAAATPSYARPNNLNGEESISGRINSFDGKYTMLVADDRGFVDTVQLHQGTVINPTGISLEPGMRVTILGYNGGHAFAANEIDTPYTSFGVEPIYAYPGYAPFALQFDFGSGYYHHWH
jgi:hypothetical protein